MPPLQLDQITNINNLEDLQEEWSHLLRRCPDATPFQSPEWMLPWWRHLGGGDLMVFAARRSGELVGLAPWFIHEWQGKSQVSPLAVSISDYFDVVCLPEVETDFVRLVLNALLAERSRWDICILPELRERSPLLHADIPHGLAATIEPLDVCPVLALPKTLRDMEAGLGAHHRRNLRRDQKLLDKLGGGSVEEADEQTLGEFLDALFNLHSARWSESGEPGVLSSPNVQSFHRAAAAGFERSGMLRLYGMRREGIITSVMYDFAFAGRVYAYLSGYDPRLDQASPGTLLTWHAIGEAISGGCCEYDFLRGGENHKYVWGAQDRRNYRLVLS